MSPDGSLITGTGEGIFVSSNEGENWRSVNGDLPDKNVQSMMLALDQLYIGTASAVYRKPMNETHWTQLDKGITFPIVSSLTGDPERGFYAGTDGEGVYRSKDGGFSWFPMNEGLADLNVRSIVEDATHTLFILTEEGIYKGDRAKKSWVLMKEGIGQKGIHALYLDSENVLYSGTDNGLFRRDVVSNYWEKMILPIDRAIKWVAGGKGRLFAISDQEIFYIQKGESNPVPISFPELQGDIRGAYFNDNLYIWTGKSIYEGKFEKQDLFWKTLPDIPAGLNCQTLDVETLNGKKVIMIGTDKGAFWSDNSGTLWHPAIGKGASVDARSFFSPYPGTLLLGTGDRGVWVGIGL
ncbi:MAG: hypothetical protein HY200_07225 [Nitrospirae bacterium]|nr:hypothetical protein [Nitrospirota bacterium]